MPDSARRPSWLLVVVVLLLLAGNLFLMLTLTRTPPPLPPEADIRAVLTAQQDAWNRGDLDGFMAGYWESEELRFASGGTVTTGYNATKTRYFQRYKADGKEMGTLTFNEVSVEVLTPELAIVRGRWRLKYVKSADEPHGLYTLTLRKFANGWKVTTDHTSAAEKN